MKIFVPVLAISALLASTVAGWSDGPIKGNLEVRITIGRECQVNPQGNALLEFGGHKTVGEGVSGNSAQTGAGSIQVRCSEGTNYTILLVAGQNPGTKGDTTTRQMKNDNGKDLIGYQLYSDEGRTKVWGYTTESGKPGLGNGAVQSHQVFGSIGKLSTVPTTGNYADTVAVTVQF